MLECAIPKCGNREKFLRSGSLDLIESERENGRVAKEMIWLCASCTSQYTVQTWRPAGEQIRRRPPDLGPTPGMIPARR